MRTLVAVPSTGSVGQQVALAFHERNALASYVTLFAYREHGALARVLRATPTSLRTRLELQLKRRAISALPPETVEDRPFWEIVRTLVEKAGGSAAMVDRIWDHLSHDFTRHAGRRLSRGVAINPASHIACGADPDKTFAVPLGAPPAIEAVGTRTLDSPLKVVWAGTFSIRKGAHYFIDAWRKVGGRGHATADVYGSARAGYAPVLGTPRGLIGKST